MHLAWCNFAEYHPTICRVPFLQMTMLEDLSCILHVITPFPCIITVHIVVHANCCGEQLYNFASKICTYLVIVHSFFNSLVQSGN